ncbi:NnrS family protein [Sulfurimonas marina]|uniref:NnrS family protein n=1 Tax=Sulfurimonas marina TaxID=2590551 RepID=A0A7M1AYL6_9BACT|nr:NnrS family protein [Sulfurimonas marina]QOP41482.1 NnrS family protein [Sulfurimonas marina]
MIKENYFLSQPHQPFFLSGTVWAVISMLFFALMYHGVFTLNISPIFFHVYTMFFMIFTPFFIGFLFTTFPRFCQSSVIERKVYIRIFSFLQFGSILFIIGAFTNPILVNASILVIFFSDILVVIELQKIYNEGHTSRASSDTLWILIGFYMGLFTHALFLVDSNLSIFQYDLNIFNIAATIGFWNYLIFIAFTVAQRMVPFFSHVTVEKRRGFNTVVFSGLLLHTVFSITALQFPQMIIDVVLGIYIFVELRRWKFDTLQSPAILWILHLALYWVPIALIVSIISINFLSLHVMAIGFLTTILIGFGTRVTLGHSGQAPHADRYVTNLFYFVQVIVVLRAAYSLFIDKLWLFDAAATAWMILYILWIGRYGSVLLNGKKIGSS